MKIIAAIVLPLLLAGCLGTAPVKRTFPDVPPELKQACPELRLVDADEKQLSEVISIVAKNYSDYHQCKIKLDLWVEWYQQQKEIFETVK